MSFVVEFTNWVNLTSGGIDIYGTRSGVTIRRRKDIASCMFSVSEAEGLKDSWSSICEAEDSFDGLSNRSAGVHSGAALARSN